MKTIITLLCLIWTSLLWGQSMQNLNNAEKLKYFFQKLDKNSMSLVSEFYSTDAEFIDPIGKMKGAAALKKYYEGLYENAEEIRFDFSNVYESGNTVVGIWSMTLKTKKLNGGEPYTVDGNSVVTFDPATGKAIYHRDYFDMGAFVYEKVPVVGFVIRKLRENLEHKEK